jgi:hypothetical protein
VERASTALSRGRQCSPRATGAGDVCAVCVRTAPERARRKLARRESRLEGEDGSADHARSISHKLRLRPICRGACGARSIRRTKNSAPRRRVGASDVMTVIMPEEQQDLLGDLRRHLLVEQRSFLSKQPYGRVAQEPSLCAREKHHLAQQVALTVVEGPRNGISQRPPQPCAERGLCKFYLEHQFGPLFCRVIWMRDASA